MGAKLNVTLLANAGLLLEYDGTLLLLDGLFGKENNLFSAPSPYVTEQLIHGRDCFKGIDYILITHDHADHFSADLLMQYLSNNTPRGVFLPAVILQCYPFIQSLLQEKRIPCFPLNPSTASTTFRVKSDITILPLSTYHLDKAFQDVVHFCYLCSFEGHHVLLTADVDYTKDSFPSLREVPLSAVFMNPLFYHSRNDVNHCLSRLQTERFVVYHVPFSDDDAYRMRDMLRVDAAHFAVHERPPIILDSPMQRTYLEL